ncbi:hypothetical protein CO051_06600 [Candidatus Roizmanbacteria bacterium CG_4_9_14_0_2_um_filter_39_13]|uniref:Type II toxin-antitoxin system mRNA interferase toxin, RelE/StbE family n=2 Tax=Candidatus Roizmaniibacteriota TaxID=1752723 RepID=A0A2M8EWN3_9BACT|nr:MAG: hypothetical protein COY15_02060 [Candidatus Roizmanbacteria bacterium CG_4_10_14_0_2_um_filter_39_12]PJC30278.1 MAG: hypothetical protein CO051_06600 [Candidatus Roizmanbacteria bacterium CG_4_9_14_0_2_um_filter_39_13]PJE61849.1 MAG: hypothetical protein COU87_02435 [Candidatus Roizmanbacteria bacterium CG10_big_fil_rev_8_21_14_0_10_39_12]
MKLTYSNHFKKRLKKQLKQNPQIRSKIHRQLLFLQTDTRHPSLKMHKLKGERLDQFAIWIEGNIRITFIIVDGVALLTDIIRHDEY